MKLNEYLKDRFLFIIINLIFFSILFFILTILEIKSKYIFFVFIIWFTPITLYIISEFRKSKVFFDDVNSTLENLDKKYLLPEVLDDPKFIEEVYFHDILKSSNKSMHENVNVYKNLQLEYMDYIETWVHEIKTPIASSMLIIENNPQLDYSNILIELNKIESFVEQALYYSKSNYVNEDYIITEFNLEDAVNPVIRRNSKSFINKKIKLELSNLDILVYSDIKWIKFIINQIISNAIKYSSNKNPLIKIYSNIYENNIVLTIEDNGIGIDNKDLKKVFNKGFTGDNGRSYEKSTGIGLYLANKLCSKLGLNIYIDSKLGSFTKVNLIFPIGNFNL